MTLKEYIKNKYVGKILIGSEFKTGKDEEDEDDPKFPQKITGARAGVSEYDFDPGIWLELEDGNEYFFFSNDEIYTQKSK